MAASDIARARLSNQHIAGTTIKTPAEIVSLLGAMQAQDYTMAKWGIGLRLPGSTEASIEAAVVEGQIIRTHILRPTWHFVAAADIRWMLALSATRLGNAMKPMNAKLELTETVLRKCSKLIEKSLSGNQHLTRPELMAMLERNKIATDDLRSNHIMFAVEISGLVCNGARRGKQHTYALLDERVPAATATKREDAIALLTRRYFSSHGPATVPDFAWWANLTLKEIKQGLEANKDHLQCATIKGQEYWYAVTAAVPAGRNAVHLLPAFDEFMVSYKDRSASLDPSLGSSVITANGIFKPMLVAKGKIMGSWKRTEQKGRTLVEPSFFKPDETLDAKALQPALKAYSAFLQQKTELIL